MDAGRLVLGGVAFAEPAVQAEFGRSGVKSPQHEHFPNGGEGLETAQYVNGTDRIRLPCDGYHILSGALVLICLASQNSQNWGGPIMRLNRAIAVAATILIGFGVKLFFFPAPIAEADASGVKSSSVNVLQMHHNGLPVQKMSDMTFVFSDD